MYFSLSLRKLYKNKVVDDFSFCFAWFSVPHHNTHNTINTYYSPTLSTALTQIDIEYRKIIIKTLENNNTNKKLLYMCIYRHPLF